MKQKQMNLTTKTILLFLFCMSVFIANAEQKQVGANTYKWLNGKYYINNELVYKTEKENITPECESFGSSSPLAFFGNMVTIMTQGSSMCKGMAHPNHHRTILTFMVNEGHEIGKEMTLLDFFSKEQIMMALKNDSYLKTQFSSENEIEIHFNKKSLYSFAFHHLNGQQVAVRLFLRDQGSQEIYRKQIGFYLEAKGKLLKSLKAASSNNLLMESFEIK